MRIAKSTDSVRKRGETVNSTKINDHITRYCFKDKQEWLDHRTRIGGSDTAAVLGISPWKSNLQLWREKTRRATPEDISDKPAVKFGVAAEPLVRELYTLDHPEYIVEYYGDNTIINDKYPYLAASLDGELIEEATGRNGVLEIKTTEIMQWTQWDKWDGGIPDYYYTQVLFYLLVTEYDFAELVARIKYHTRDGEFRVMTKHYHIEAADVQEDIAYMYKELKRFNDYIESDTEPPHELPQI